MLAADALGFLDPHPGLHQAGFLLVGVQRQFVAADFLCHAFLPCMVDQTNV